MFVDVSFPNHMAELAALTGHLTPKKLQEELASIQPAGGKWPKILAVHMNPADKDELASELDIVSQELGIDLSPGIEGMTISI